MKSLILACTAGILISGCESPQSKAVRIDLDRVVLAEPAGPSLDVSVPRPPASQPARTITLPGFAARIVRDPSKADPARIQRLLAQEQLDAQKRLNALLREFYRTQARAFDLDQQRSVAEREQIAYREANQKIRTAFERLAEVRGPKLARLSILAGFPDANPNSKPPIVELGNVSQARFDEAKQLREQIDALDLGFKAEAKSILQSVEEFTAQQRAAALVALELFRDELNRQAEAEAKAQVKHATDSLRLELANLPPMELPAVPSRSVTLPAEPALKPAPEVPSIGIGQSEADRRALARHELTIWLGLNRFVLSGNGPDKTEEFIRWRSEHRLNAIR